MSPSVDHKSSALRPSCRTCMAECTMLCGTLCLCTHYFLSPKCPSFLFSTWWVPISPSKLSLSISSESRDIPFILRAILHASFHAAYFDFVYLSLLLVPLLVSSFPSWSQCLVECQLHSRCLTNLRYLSRKLLIIIPSKRQDHFSQGEGEMNSLISSQF